jgi:U3 small nucleolar RNA-associated protein 25
MDKVPRGVRQVWTRFECEDVSLEEEKRFEWFTQKVRFLFFLSLLASVRLTSDFVAQTLPTLLRSAVSSSQTLLLVPSYFDFLRVKRYLATANSLPSDFSFAAISEYTDTPDVSRARGAFIQGKVKWLVVTERFHFYKRFVSLISRFWSPY